MPDNKTDPLDAEDLSDIAGDIPEEVVEIRAVPELPLPKSAWDVVFAAVITKTIQSPARYYFKGTAKPDAMKAFLSELKSEYGASEVKILKFEEAPLDIEALQASVEASETLQ